MRAQASDDAIVEADTKDRNGVKPYFMECAKPSSGVIDNLRE